MKKYSRLFSVLALVLAVTLVFSGCGLTSVLMKKTDGETESAVESVEFENSADNNANYDNTFATDSAVITPAGDETATTDNTTAAQTDNSVTNSANAGSATSKKPVDTTQSTKVNTTTGSKPVKTTSTAATSSTTNLTTEDIEQLPVKEIQDMLFATTDPNTAGKILNACGFEYDQKQGIYYSTMEPLQRLFGYNFIYDMAAPRVGMIYSTERIKFNYNGKDWMIQLWKGQYGITAGAEIGLYNKTDKIMHYECASNDELIEMAFDFYNQGEYVFSRGPEKHWWLTGFKIFNSGVGILIDLDITLKFPDVAMANAFEKGLKKTASQALLDPITYTRTALTFKIHW